MMPETGTVLSVKVKAAIKRQGRSVVWLCNAMGVNRPYFYDRMRDNMWSAGDIIRIKRLLGIGE